jgi:hypothetical protein
MENASASQDERQSDAGGLALLPILLCLSAVFAVCMGLIALVLSRDVLVSVGIGGVLAGAGAAVSWWIAPRLVQ